MGRITIKDLPKEMKISKDELRKISGGYSIIQPETDYYLLRPGDSMENVENRPKAIIYHPIKTFTVDPLYMA